MILCNTVFGVGDSVLILFCSFTQYNRVTPLILFGVRIVSEFLGPTVCNRAVSWLFRGWLV